MEKLIRYGAPLLGFLAARMLGANTSVMILAGGAVGLVCGLLPYFTSKDKAPDFARTALWVCAGTGMAGGALFAVPVAGAMAFVGYRKSKSVAG